MRDFDFEINNQNAITNPSDRILLPLTDPKLSNTCVWERCELIRASVARSSIWHEANSSVNISRIGSVWVALRVMYAPGWGWNRWIKKKVWLFWLFLISSNFFFHWMPYICFTGGNLRGSGHSHTCAPLLRLLRQLRHHSQIPAVELLRFLCQVLSATLGFC